MIMFGKDGCEANPRYTVTTIKTKTKEMTLEECLEYIAEDELVEVTPENVRMRKQDLVKFKSI